MPLLAYLAKRRFHGCFLRSLRDVGQPDLTGYPLPQDIPLHSLDPRLEVAFFPEVRSREGQVGIVAAWGSEAIVTLVVLSAAVPDHVAVAGFGWLAKAFVLTWQ